MVNIWRNHDCRPAVAIELDEDSWEVIILRSCIPTVEDYLRESNIGLQVNAEYDITSSMLGKRQTSAGSTPDSACSLEAWLQLSGIPGSLHGVEPTHRLICLCSLLPFSNYRWIPSEIAHRTTYCSRSHVFPVRRGWLDCFGLILSAPSLSEFKRDLTRGSLEAWWCWWGELA
jgi:hypothetical protein